LLSFWLLPAPQASGRKMRRNRQRLLGLGISILAALILSSAASSQVSGDSDAAVSAPTDWSHHHVIFSQPATAEQATRVQADPRYWQQQQRHAPMTLPETEAGVLAPSPLSSNTPRPAKNRGLKRDWSQDIGPGATVGAGNYPAKFSFSSTTANCASATQPDFVVYGTGLAGSATQASIVAYDNLYSGCNLLNLGTAANFAILASSTVTNAGASVVTGANIGISPGTSLTGFPPGVLTAPAVQHLGDAVAAQAQADASTAYTFYQGLPGAMPIAPVLDGLTFTPGLFQASSSLALSAGATVTLNGSGTYVFQIGSTLEIAGTVVLSGGATAGNVIWLVGSSATVDGTGVADGDIIAQASITLDSGASLAGRAIALTGAVTMIDNAVTTLDSVPSVYWAYNTADGTVNTSPVFSRDGKQLAFVQAGGGFKASIVILKWAPSSTDTVGSPTTLTRTTNGMYPACVAPCMTSAILQDTSSVVHFDTHSSVFYDYSSDTAYVGDDGGWLHQFNPVFNGVPAEVRSAGWPVQVNPLIPTPLTSPIFDFTSGRVFVADKGGFLYRVGPNTAFVATSSGPLDVSSTLDSGPGIVEGPIVDSTAQIVYVFAASDGSGTCVGGADCSAVYELSTNFAATSTGGKSKVGASTHQPAPPQPLYGGGFDSSYLNSADSTGNMYVCGNTGGPPVLYQIGITAGTMNGFGTPLAVIANTTTPCSPVTDLMNPNVSGGPTERLFASVQTQGVNSACSNGGCIFNFKDTPWQPATAYTVGQEVLDTQLQIQVVSVAGTSGSATPGWSTTVGNPTTDGTVQWLNQGAEAAFTVATWQSGHAYALHQKILDANNNVEFVTTAGTSGGTVPTFNTTAGGNTSDGATLQWTNLGAIGTAALAAAGGTSGIIIDNTVNSGTQPGASQVYFSTLNGGCGSGTDGCAVQASQPALQ
jgi:hypothetical protein